MTCAVLLTTTCLQCSIQHASMLLCNSVPCIRVTKTDNVKSIPAILYRTAHTTVHAVHLYFPSHAVMHSCGHARVLLACIDIKLRSWPALSCPHCLPVSHACIAKLARTLCRCCFPSVRYDVFTFFGDILIEMSPPDNTECGF